MSLPITRQSYQDCYSTMDRALADPAGIRVKVGDIDASVYFRMRCHQARQIIRRDNAKLYSPDHPMHGCSTYDALIIRLRRHADDEVWVYFERTDVQIKHIESLSGQELPSRTGIRMEELAPEVIVDDFAETVEEPKSTIARRI